MPPKPTTCVSCRGSGRETTLGCTGCSKYGGTLPLGMTLCHCGTPGIPFTNIKGMKGCPTCNFRGFVQCLMCRGSGNEIKVCPACAGKGSR